MQIREDLRRAYDEAVAEYNVSPLAVDDGWWYEKSAWSLFQLQTIADQLPPGGTFLDIGTGKGIAPRTLSKLGYHVITVDSPDAAGDSALANARLAGIEGHHCHVGRDPLPVPDGSVDAVGAFDVIEHLPDTPRPFVDALGATLKPSGSLLLGTPNAVRLTVRMKMLLGFSNWPAVRDYLDVPKNFLHHHEYTRDELRWLLQECGFPTVEVHLFEARLGQLKIASVKDLDTQHRKRRENAASSLPIRLAGRGLRLVAQARPTLRSEMIAVAKRSASA